MHAKSPRSYSMTPPQAWQPAVSLPPTGPSNTGTMGNFLRRVLLKLVNKKKIQLTRGNVRMFATRQCLMALLNNFLTSVLSETAAASSSGNSPRVSQFRHSVSVSFNNTPVPQLRQFNGLSFGRPLRIKSEMLPDLIL